jgi:Flp pilus assembly protein TadB
VIVAHGLGLGWGVVIAWVFLLLTRGTRAAMRTKALDRSHRRSRQSRSRVRFSVPPAVVSVCTAPARARRARRDREALVAEVPVVVDLVAVAVAAGCTPFLAVELAARDAPPRTRSLLADVLRACALGASFDDALRDLGRRAEPMRMLTETLRTTARLGAPVAPALARVSSEVRADVRRRAEARARTIPVRLCFPLVGCVLPAFACLTVVPVVLDGLRP